MTTTELKYQKELFGVTEDDFTRVVIESIGLSERMQNESVTLLREWYLKQPHLPKISLDDRYLKRALSLNKFSVEKTKLKLDNFFTARSIIPEFFGNRDPWTPEISKALDATDWAIIPKYTKENYRIMIIKIVAENPDDFNPLDFAIASFLIGDLRMTLDIAWGEVHIWDLKNIKLGHVVKMNPAMLKKSMFVVQSCYGAKVKAIHILNLPPYAETALNIMKSVMVKKLGDRIFVHKSVEDLHKVVSKELLPKDMGGDNERTCKDYADELRKVVKSPEWRKWYLDSCNIKTDESKRPNQSETMVDDLLGIRGTFRKLEID